MVSKPDYPQTAGTHPGTLGYAASTPALPLIFHVTSRKSPELPVTPLSGPDLPGEHE